MQKENGNLWVHDRKSVHQLVSYPWHFTNEKPYSFASTYLQLQSGVHDRISDLGNGTSNEETSGDNADYGSKGKDLLDKVGEELVGRHTDGDGCQDHLKNTRNDTKEK